MQRRGIGKEATLARGSSAIDVGLLNPFADRFAPVEGTVNKTSIKAKTYIVDLAKVSEIEENIDLGFPSKFFQEEKTYMVPVNFFLEEKNFHGNPLGTRQITLDFDKIDNHANNAGIGYAVTLSQTALSNTQQVIDLNLTSLFGCIKEILPSMHEHNRGTMLNLAPLGSLRGMKSKTVNTGFDRLLKSSPFINNQSQQ
ncbi:MAG: SDR family NAD(P)-dependent oxidoreductase [Cyanobacteria bacterium P01_D01_bin.50]